MDDWGAAPKRLRGNCSGGTNGLDPNYNNTGSPLRGWFRLPPVGIRWRHWYRRYSAHHTYRLFVVRTRGIVIFWIHSRHTSPIPELSGSLSIWPCARPKSGGHRGAASGQDPRVVDQGPGDGDSLRKSDSQGSRPSSWWRFGTVGRGALTQWRRWKVVCSRCGCGQRSTAWRIVQRAQRRYQALRLTAHRCAAAGLDSGTAPAVLASMPSTPQWIA